MNDDNFEKPEWQPENGGAEFASKIVKGKPVAKAEKYSPPAERLNKINLSPEELAGEVRKGNRAILARTITLVESNSQKHREIAKKILNKLDGLIMKITQK